MSSDHAGPPGPLTDTEESTQGCSAQDDASRQATRDVLDFVTRVTSPTKVESNRKNAKRSTGPRTAGGKANSRLNGLCHGAFATLRLLPGEDEQVYEELSVRMFSEAEPKTSVERMLVGQIVGDLWRLRRVDQAEGAYFEQISEASCLRGLKSRGAQHVPLSRFAVAREHQAVGSNPPGSLSAECFSTASTCETSSENAPDETTMRPHARPHTAQARCGHDKVDLAIDPGKLMLDGMVDPERAFPFRTLEYIRRSLVRDVLRKNDKLAELQRVRMNRPAPLAQG